jgi:peroxiredoxin
VRSLAVALAFSAVTSTTACRPEKVVIPHEPSRPAHGEVDRDVSGAANAPAAIVHASDGSTFDLAQLWQKQRVVLVFYMGGWCPHCQKQLGELDAHLPDFSALDTTIVAVSSDAPGDAKALRDKLGLKFELYSDASLATIAAWGVEDFGANIARPATFVVEPGGAISFRKVGDKPTDRPTSADILAAIRAKQ